MTRGVYASNDNWTCEQAEAVIHGARSGKTVREVAEDTGRSVPSVKTFASRHSIQFSRYSHGSEQRPWTSEQDMWLAELAPTTPYQDIANRLERSLPAVRVRAFKLGIVGRAHNERMRGSDHPSWRGGSQEQRLDRGPNWPQFRAAVLVRDAYTCQDCGMYVPSGKRLVVHHTIPWRLRPVNDMEHLTTLCVADHLRRPEHWWKEIPVEVT